MDVNKLHKGFTTNPCRLHNIWCSNPSFSLHPKVVAEEDVAVTEAAAAEAAQVVTSSSNLLNDTQYQVLPLQNPGLELTMLSGDPLHCVFPVTPPDGEKTLSVLSLPEREKTPRGEGKTPCVQPPPEGGKTLCVQSPPEGEKTLVVQSRDTSNLVQFKSVFIQEKDLPVGGRRRQFLPEWENMGPTG